MTAGCALYMGTLSTVPDYAGKPMATFPDILMAFFPMNPTTIPAQIWSP